jgi:capsular polysaccharide biosynthesis protein
VTEPLSIGQFGRVLTRHWLLIVSGLLLGGLVGFGVTQFMTPVYTATATQLVKGLPGPGAAANYEAAQYAVSRAKSYPAFIYSLSILEGVRSDMGNAEDIVQLRKELSATNPIDTPLVRISATGPTPQLARDKANSAARHMARFITQIETVAGKSPISVETAVQAGLPPEPTSPKTLLVAALGAMVGLVLAIGASIIHTQALARRKATQPKATLDRPLEQSVGTQASETLKSSVAVEEAARHDIPETLESSSQTTALQALSGSQDPDEVIDAVYNEDLPKEYLAAAESAEAAVETTEATATVGILDHVESLKLSESEAGQITTIDDVMGSATTRETTEGIDAIDPLLPVEADGSADAVDTADSLEREQPGEWAEAADTVNLEAIELEEAEEWAEAADTVNLDAIELNGAEEWAEAADTAALADAEERDQAHAQAAALDAASAVDAADVESPPWIAPWWIDDADLIAIADSVEAMESAEDVESVEPSHQSESPMAPLNLQPGSGLHSDNGAEGFQSVTESEPNEAQVDPPQAEERSSAGQGRSSGTRVSAA